MSHPRSDKGPTKPVGRREQRIFAFQVLYCLPFQGTAQEPSLVQKTFDNFAQSNGISVEKEDNFAWNLVRGVVENLEILDSTVNSYSSNWKLGRIAKVELSIIRLAIFEILFLQDIPAKVTINEAVEIAKRFGDEHSKNFINGILDAVAKDAGNGKLGLCPQE